ncbi:hypothetical protein D3C73_1476500 [compost metagenome]
MRLVHVACPDRRRQAIRRGVGTADDFRFSVKRRDVADGAENFFRHAARVIGQARDQGGLDPEAAIQRIAEAWRAAAHDEPRPFFSRQRVVAKHLVAMSR